MNNNPNGPMSQVALRTRIETNERVTKNLMEFVQGSLVQLGESVYKISLTQAALVEHFNCDKEVTAICRRIEQERKDAYEKEEAAQKEKMAKRLDDIAANKTAEPTTNSETTTNPTD